MGNFLRYSTVFRLYELVQPFLKYSLPVERDLPGRNVLVLAPHPDDEAIGCGGIIARHAAAGGTVSVAYCTMDTPERRAESQAAAAVAGIASTDYFDYPVESLASQEALPDRLNALFAARSPDVVFLPFFMDNHTDHRALNSAFARAAERRPCRFMVYAYPVWFPLYPNVLVDIGDCWDRKRRMIECYASQTATRDYVTMSRSLGAYWAAVKGRDLSVVETFFRATASTYASLARAGAR